MDLGALALEDVAPPADPLLCRRWVLDWHDAVRGARAWRERQVRLNAARAPDQAFAATLRWARRAVPHYRDLVSTVPLEELRPFQRGDYDRDPARFRAAEMLSRPKKSTGTTGTPLTVFFDDAAWFEANQATFSLLCERVPAPTVVLVTTRADAERYVVPLPLLRGTHRRVSIGRDEDDAVITELRARPPAILHGKPSCLLALARADAARAGEHIRPARILTSGENFFPDDRRTLTEWFGSPVTDAYTSVEGGLIGLECPVGSGLHVPPERMLEVETERDQLRTTGSGRLILTNLTNWATVFLRYRTDDFGTLTHGDCSCGHSGQTISEFYGREVVQFRDGNRFVEVAALTAALDLPDMPEYQFACDGDGYVLRVAVGDTERAELDTEVRAALRPILGAAHLDIVRTPTLTPPGGKAWRFRDYSSNR
ncbi:phenylacetate-coenzyme A ligase PaaK-like adenylate-forming protein [Nocardia tenerifensis]|uniref:Phenylacetate-coenzyme A ligase PaaK-like adenylate-forming protein n=1 Tax=Nocardia tenerifensis TaxID=228006 RepID=A0A318K497_9NOCA|nr:phenylacetate-coenzyme A ligase PaaK-like adenylate-forming protein [Nocardia tenerifensis]